MASWMHWKYLQKMNNHELLGKVTDTLFYFHKNRIPGIEQFVESFRPNQIKCKTWLVDELATTKTSFDKVLVVGSWNSVLLYELMNQECDVSWFHFLDNNPLVHKHRDIYFKYNKMDLNYDSIIEDATNFSDFEKYDLIINASCEHMKPLPTVYGPLYVLQSNNYTSIEEHINCVNSTNELKEQYKITQTSYVGTKTFDNYKRFMVIGSHW